MNFNKDENDLIDNALKNREAFEKFVHLYYEEVLNYIYKRTLDRNVSEDLTEETFLKVFNNLHSFKRKCPLIFWILRIATNIVNNYYRKETRSRKLKEKLKNNSPTKNAENTTQEEYARKILYEHIKSLRPDYQTAIILKFFNNASNKEIAVVLNKTPSAAGKIVYRALEALKKDIEKSVPDLKILRLIYGDEKDEEG